MGLPLASPKSWMTMTTSIETTMVTWGSPFISEAPNAFWVVSARVLTVPASAGADP